MMREYLKPYAKYDGLHNNIHKGLDNKTYA